MLHACSSALGGRELILLLLQFIADQQRNFRAILIHLSQQSIEVAGGTTQSAISSFTNGTNAVMPPNK